MQDLITKLSSDGRSLKMGSGQVTVIAADGTVLFEQKGKDKEALLCKAIRQILGPEALASVEEAKIDESSKLPAKEVIEPISKPGAIKVINKIHTADAKDHDDIRVAAAKLLKQKN